MGRYAGLPLLHPPALSAVSRASALGPPGHLGPRRGEGQGSRVLVLLPTAQEGEVRLGLWYAGETRTRGEAAGQGSGAGHP